MGVDDAGDADPASGELLDDHRVGRQVEAHAPVLLGDRDPEQPELLHLLDDRLRELVLVVVVLGVGDDLLVGELPDHLADRLLFVGAVWCAVSTAMVWAAPVDDSVLRGASEDTCRVAAGAGAAAPPAPLRPVGPLRCVVLPSGCVFSEVLGLGGGGIRLLVALLSYADNRPWTRRSRSDRALSTGTSPASSCWRSGWELSDHLPLPDRRLYPVHQGVYAVGRPPSCRSRRPRPRSWPVARRRL